MKKKLTNSDWIKLKAFIRKQICCNCGQSAYELAVQQGFEGTLEEWLESLNGEDGINGEDFVFKGNITITDAPTDIGLYVPTESGTYTNAGGLVVDLSGGINLITYDGTNWGLILLPSPQHTQAAGGFPIEFVNLKIYGTFTTPLTGNISQDLTGANIGIIQKIYHDDTVEPTYPAGWALLGSNVYIPNKLNIIYADYSGGTRVEYWIEQEN